MELNGRKEVSVAESPPDSEGVGQLLHNYKQSLDHKDFNAEIRGLLDVKGLLEKCSVLLDVDDRPNSDPSTSSLESIVDAMLDSMMAGTTETVTKAELKSLIFANSEMDLLSNTVQALEQGEINQNWLCSATEVPSLNRRMVGLARLSENTNMGEGANEVKFFILILCPSNIKGKFSHNSEVQSVLTSLSNMYFGHGSIFYQICSNRGIHRKIIELQNRCLQGKTLGFGDLDFENVCTFLRYYEIPVSESIVP